MGRRHGKLRVLSLFTAPLLKVSRPATPDAVFRHYIWAIAYNRKWGKKGPLLGEAGLGKGGNLGNGVRLLLFLSLFLHWHRSILLSVQNTETRAEPRDVVADRVLKPICSGIAGDLSSKISGCRHFSFLSDRPLDGPFLRLVRKFPDTPPAVSRDPGGTSPSDASQRWTVPASRT